MDGARRRPWQRRGLPLVAIACTGVGLLFFLSACEDLQRAARARAEIRELHQAISMCFLFKRPLPSSLEELSTVVPCTEDEFREHFATPPDPWGRPWIYEVTGRNTFRIRCLGADGLLGGTGADADISSDDP